MKKWLLAVLLTIPGCLFGQYAYQYIDQLTSISTTNWYQNGSLTATIVGLTAPTANGGALVYKPAWPDGTSDYEVYSQLKLPTAGTYTFYQLVRASSDAMAGPSPVGTYYSIEIQNPTLSSGNYTATLAINKRVSNSVTLLTSTSISCYNGMIVRTVVHGSSIFVIYSSPYSGNNLGWPAAISTTDSSGSPITSGAPGVGAYGITPSGDAISPVQLGLLDRIAPNAVNGQSVGTYILPTQVQMQWQGVVDNQNGIGLWDYHVYRCPGSPCTLVQIGETFTPGYLDEAVRASTLYTYGIQAFDAHQNAAAMTTFTVQTLASGQVEARRIGVRSLGSYWGDAGEQIDTLSGNLNFTIPLLTAMGRGGWSASFNLNYNSQAWRQDPGPNTSVNTWNLGLDVGYGFGWHLMAGSITPIWEDTWTIDHFVYTDSTGAEYWLNQYDSTNCMWTSLGGVYVGYNPCVNRLYFPDGSFWTMGATSGGIEQDAGTLYPTQMEDTNGNQINIKYQNGVASPQTNSSGRITSIEDVRAIQTGGSGPYQTIVFTYNTDPIPHLTAVEPWISGVGQWNFSYLNNQGLYSPFSPAVSFGTTTLLSSVQGVGNGLAPYQFQYASAGSGTSGELTHVTTMYGGVLGWAHRSFTYTGSRTFREVQYRYLTMQSGGTQYTYTFTRNDTTDAGLSIHSGVTLDDPSGIGEKAWTFTTSGTFYLLGLTSSYEVRPSAAQASAPLQHKDFTWVQDSNGTPYIGTVVTTLDPTGANVQTKTTQTLDTHGNLTQTNIYDYGNLTTPARTYNYTYGYSFASNLFTTYRMTQTQVTSGSQTVTLVTNNYDSTVLTIPTGTLREHDSNYGTGATARGNLSATTPVGGALTTTINRDITGNVVSATDNFNHTASVSASTLTNYAAPNSITPNSNTNLTQSMTYAQSLAVNSVTGPNTATASATYDVWNRPTSTTSVYGATTGYAYSNGVTPAYQQATTNLHWVTSYYDGFGRVNKATRGNGSTTVSPLTRPTAPVPAPRSEK
jgi:hypothetical protein